MSSLRNKPYLTFAFGKTGLALSALAMLAAAAVPFPSQAEELPMGSVENLPIPDEIVIPERVNELELRWHMDPRWFAEDDVSGYFFIDFVVDGESMIDRLMQTVTEDDLKRTFYGAYAGMLQCEHGKQEWIDPEANQIEVYKGNRGPMEQVDEFQPTCGTGADRELAAQPTQ
ncbi:MAG: hypothetical protein R3F46_12815 [bacterium]